MRFHRRQRVARRRWAAFTLVELLVAIAIIGTLIALLLPAVQAAREAARRSVCTSRQGQVALAMLAFEELHSQFPAGRLGCDDEGETGGLAQCPPGLSPSEKTGASGFIEILPHLEQRSLYQELAVQDGGLWNRNVSDLSWYYYDTDKRESIKQRLEVFNCPSDLSEPLSDTYAPVVAATASYVMVHGSMGPATTGYTKRIAKYENDGLFIYKQPRRVAEVTDGQAQTMMIGEVVLAHEWESTNTWTYARLNADALRTTSNPLNTPPGDGEVDARQNGAFGSQHPAGAVFAFADGHVQFIQDEIELPVYRGFSTIAAE